MGIYLEASKWFHSGSREVEHGTQCDGYPGVTPGYGTRRSEVVLVYRAARDPKRGSVKTKKKKDQKVSQNCFLAQLVMIVSAGSSGIRTHALRILESRRLLLRRSNQLS